MNLASTCCACDHIDRGEESFTPQVPRNSNKLVYEPHVPAHAAGGFTSASASAVSHTAGGALAEKARLQEFVKDFAKCAVRGVSCEVVDSESGEVIPVVYFVDPGLQKLSLRRGSGSDAANSRANADGIPYREIELSSIQDVFDLEAAQAVGQAGKMLLPEVVLRRVHSENGLSQRLLVIALMDSTPSLCLLEGSAVDRDRFIMCVKVLRLCAQRSTMDTESNDSDNLGMMAFS